MPSEGGPYGRRLANGSLVPLVNGEWLWDGEPEAAYKVTQELHPKSGTAIVWLSETVHQVEPVSAGTRKSFWVLLQFVFDVGFHCFDLIA